MLAGRGLGQHRHVGWQRSALDVGLGQLLDRLQKTALLVVAEADRHAAGTRARRATNAVHIRLGLHGQVEVEHVRDAVHVQAARGDVRGHQHRRAAAAEGVQRLGALALRLVAVDRVAGDARGAQALHDLVGAVLGLGEHHGALHRIFAQQVRQQIHLARTLDGVQALVDALHGAGGRRHRHFNRMVQQRVGQLADLGRHGGAEQHGLALGRHRRGDATDGFDETHVQHAIGLIEREELDAAKIDQSLVHQVDQATGRGHQDRRTVADGLHLRALPHATEDDGVTKADVAAIGGEAFADLRGQLARGRKNERARALDARMRRLRAESMQRGQREGSGLAGAGLRDAQNVMAFQRGRNRLRLNGRGCGIAFLANCLQQCGSQRESVKMCQEKCLSPSWPKRQESLYRTSREPTCWNGTGPCRRSAQTGRSPAGAAADGMVPNRILCEWASREKRAW